MGKAEVIIDFSDHYTGYLHISAQGMPGRIPDSPALINFRGICTYKTIVWAILSSALTIDESCELLRKTKETDPKIRMSSPFMTHYYLEVLFYCGEFNTEEDYIKEYWGAMIDSGFDY